ncbi:L,D-transpeptidase [Candidatus Thioglobus sp.]|nr:L,D-transpeptidase [Candidatus Thioglobus sp.]MDB3892579.1 L,D-transpeptidase [Candidatus Thioglobus sp.]MDC0888298.1 L,D-transpeptidase [Candidatus Thioglobus sp.]MDC0904534.1 L,D-transpeptidase [Candidatus Thioglobus sp.]MDC0920715.1 L,D-transpeptidase [Candidatus Thioglobus sp.]
MITINIANQTLTYKDTVYLISSAANGVGEIQGSFCTPLGKFKIAEKIGDDLELGSVLVGRVPTGEVYSKKLFDEQPGRDWILSRILWLDGVESHNKNTKQRYIYIHGSADEFTMGKPGSKGCIRMKNSDIINLFSQVQAGEEVDIQ